MKNLNQIFFEEYKRLDKLCKEIYGESTGVTSYIDDMKSIYGREKDSVRDFDHTLKRLIEVRHIRNKLSHEVDSFDIPLCDEGDIKFLQEFREKILNGSDPLSIINKNRRARVNNAASPLRKSTPKNDFGEKTPNGCLKAIGTFIIFIVLFVLSVLASNWIKG